MALSTPSASAGPQERAYNAARENLREAWAALAMIRETVETLAPSGSVTAAEHLDGPTFMHEADALVKGIMALASAGPQAEADNFKLVYVKRWRTLVKLPTKYADEIVEALRAHPQPQTDPWPGERGTRANPSPDVDPNLFAQQADGRGPIKMKCSICDETIMRERCDDCPQSNAWDAAIDLTERSILSEYYSGRLNGDNRIREAFKNLRRALSQAPATDGPPNE